MTADGENSKEDQEAPDCMNVSMRSGMEIIFKKTRTQDSVEERERFQNVVLRLVRLGRDYADPLYSASIVTFQSRKHVHESSSSGVALSSETKHSTSADSESDEARNAPRAVRGDQFDANGTGNGKHAPSQNVPTSPRQLSSIRVAMGFMLRQIPKTEL